MKTAWIFPGQGAQVVGMGKQFCAVSKAARNVYETADAALGTALSELCFNGPTEELTLTANLQPALLTTCIAVLRGVQELWPELPVPHCAAGHSLGEYSALVAADAFSVTDAVRLVQLRGQAMQEAVAPGEGGMLAIIGGDASAVAALCQEARENDVLAPANHNCPGQIVIAGTAAAIERAKELSKARKLRAIPLNVSAPFHCALMKPAALRVETALTQINVAPLRFPVVSNVEAQPNHDAARVPDLLVRQIDGAVLWEQTIHWMAAGGVTHAVEIGPGRVLAGLVKKTTSKIDVVNVSEPEHVDALRERWTAALSGSAEAATVL